MVVHLAPTGDPGPAKVGFAVSRAVGIAVIRNQVKRRLRHAMRSRVGSLPHGSLIVVRALPAAASASFVELGADLDQCLARVGAEGAA